MALLAKGNFKEKGRQNTYAQKKDRYYCTFCKIGGHSLDRCFKANPDRPICTHFQILGHQVDKCYKLHGYPPVHKFSGKEKVSANQAMTSLSPAQGVGNSKSQVSLSQKQISQLMALLKPVTNSQSQNHSTNNDQSVITSTSTDENLHLLSGMSLCMSVIKLKYPNMLNVPWTLDTGATDHMIYSSSFYSSIRTEAEYSIALPNGNVVPVTHIGTAKDLSTWKTIGMGEVKEGLYHMMVKDVSSSALSDYLNKLHIQTQIPISASATSNIQDFDV
ncbi:uncharacterized protein LOC111399070 [Olea europaea var. sylvestris]|uniref:uncharacterized protein LOC111399070 n=1 Tax=Olea europaea var. sylvestris TaxID=158386 RepID=UPI000C1CF9C8|nr:uncharacterized protein LOC111399070 [Olea europaea var. sylvestris]